MARKRATQPIPGRVGALGPEKPLPLKPYLRGHQGIPGEPRGAQRRLEKAREAREGQVGQRRTEKAKAYKADKESQKKVDISAGLRKRILGSENAFWIICLKVLENFSGNFGGKVTRTF